MDVPLASPSSPHSRSRLTPTDDIDHSLRADMVGGIVESGVATEPNDTNLSENDGAIVSEDEGSLDILGDTLEEIGSTLVKQELV